MAHEELSFETGHDDLIHDAQLDFYGSRLATASSDRSIQVFDVSEGQHNLVTSIRGHDGPVWSVAWSHPKFGNLLASCSYDCRVIVWKQHENALFHQVYCSESAQSSVNSVAWSPPEFGLMLLAVSSDNYISVYTYENNQWKESRFLGHVGGVNACSWGPAVASGSVTNAEDADAPVAKRFVTAGNDNFIRIWRLDENTGQWSEENAFEQGQGPHHNDWVCDVAWAPSLGLPSSTMASCSEDKTCIIWSEGENGIWKKAKTIQFTHKVWRVSWSIMGNILAISQGDNKVSLWKESLGGDWEEISSVDEGKAPRGPADMRAQ